MQSLIVVVRSAGTASTDNFFWPQAWGGSFTVPGGSANMNVLGMPDDRDTLRDTCTIPETSHELGHNLGYPDLYTNPNPLYSTDVQSRDITNYDLMSSEGELPHMSVAQKMETGWVRRRAVSPRSRCVSPTVGTTTSGTDARRAARSATSSFRPTPATPPTAPCSAPTVISQSFTFPIARPRVMRLRPDAEGENSFFSSGRDYKETDASSMAIADFPCGGIAPPPHERSRPYRPFTEATSEIGVLRGIFCTSHREASVQRSDSFNARRARARINLTRLAASSQCRNWGNSPSLARLGAVRARLRSRTVHPAAFAVVFFAHAVALTVEPHSQWLSNHTSPIRPSSRTNGLCTSRSKTVRFLPDLQRFASETARSAFETTRLS